MGKFPKYLEVIGNVDITEVYENFDKLKDIISLLEKELHYIRLFKSIKKKDRSKEAKQKLCQAIIERNHMTIEKTLKTIHRLTSELDELKNSLGT